jgi:hypothetical protein
MARPSPPQIKPEEWNTGISCPEQELEECLVYECARRTTFWPIVFETLRKIAEPKEFVAAETGWARVFEFLCLFSEFPKKPWLSIPAKKRTERLDAYLRREPRRLFQVGTPGLAPDPSANPPVQPFHSLSEHGDLLPTNAIFEMTTRWNDGSEILYKYCFKLTYGSAGDRRVYVDWSRADHEIVAAFKKWLKAERPPASAIYGSRGKKPKGQNVLRSALNGLVALNLRELKAKLPSLSRSVAINAAAHEKNGYTVKLFADAASMRRAEKAAMQRIEAISPSSSNSLPATFGNAIPNPGKTTVVTIEGNRLCFLRDFIYERE